MYPFSFIQAATNQTVISTLSGSNTAKIIAGGTNQLDLMKMNVERPQQLVDINNLALQKIESLSGGGVRIGALVRNTDLAYDPIISKQYPVLSQALLSGASAQLRNMATTGGNILQRTRCSYFWDTAIPCNKREPGSGCSALTGYNRYHAILGASNKCIAVHPSDMAVAMTALDAVVRVQGVKGERTIPIADFHLLPGDTPHIETVLAHDELITAIDLPAMSFAANSHYQKTRDRTSYAFALVSAAVALEVSGGNIRNARVALGGVAHKPWRSTDAEQALIGKPANAATFKTAADVALKNAKTFKYNAYKVELAKRTMIKGLTSITAAK
jgi:xanthine dehydrogenase YagS FAD-binding subunit